MKKWWLSCVWALCMLCAVALADAPVIVTHPADVTAPVGEKATFTVAATGDSDLSYQWQVLLPGEDDWRKTSAPGYATPQLTIQVTASVEGRRYRCIVTDASGLWASTQSAVLHVGRVGAASTQAAATAAPPAAEDGADEVWLPLEILTQPANVAVDEGGDAVFAVVAQGTGLSYQWQTLVPGEDKWRNSTLRGNRTDAMRFSAPAWQNGRKYRCVITDGEGNTLISDEVLLTVGDAPVVLAITAQPESQTAAEGEEAAFTVETTGRGLSFRWQTLADAEKGWQDTSLQGFDTPTLRLTVRAAQDGRQFRCIVTDREGESLTSEPATLTVDFPRLKTQPADLTVQPGAVVAFLAEAEGDGPFTYRWQTLADEETGWQATALPGYDTDTLSFTAELRHNGRQYRCVVTFPDGRRVTSDPALLTVALPAGPALTLQPADLTVGVGQEASFTVAVAEDTGEVSYQWEVSVDGGESWVASSTTGCKTDTLRFVTVGSHNGRMYRCVVTDADGGETISDEVTLTVRKGPDITLQPEDLTVTVGEEAAFTVAAAGEGELSYQWQVSVDGGEHWQNSSTNGCRTDTLTFITVGSHNGRQYRCLVSDAYSTTASQAATLTVQPAPRSRHQRLQPIGYLALAEVKLSDVTGQMEQLKASFRNYAISGTGVVMAASHRLLSEEIYPTEAGDIYQAGSGYLLRPIWYSGDTFKTVGKFADTITITADDVSHFDGLRLNVALSANGNASNEAISPNEVAVYTSSSAALTQARLVPIEPTEGVENSTIINGGGVLLTM